MGDRYGLSHYHNAGPKPPNGVGVLQDLSNARILSNEPFIISFEFPKIGKSGELRKPRFGPKRSRFQRKKNRRPRRFRHTVLPDGDLLDRTKRFHILQPHPGYDFHTPALLVPEDHRRGKNLVDNHDTKASLDKSNFGRFLKLESEEDIMPVPVNEPRTSILQQILNSKKADDSSEETIDANGHKKWEDIKNKWVSLFPKDKESNNQVDEEEEKLRLKSHKIWANCQLLKLLKAPQKNPFFYKLLPPNYPALIMDEEKQLQCENIYDITDLSRDKKMIADKIEQLENILSSEFKPDIKVPEMILNRAEENSKLRRKRDVPMLEKRKEHENTLHDESLQGKSEGDGRSDRSRRTKKRLKNRRDKETHKIKDRRQKDAPKPNPDRHSKEHRPIHRGGSRNGRMAEAVQEITNDIPRTNKLDEKDVVIKPEYDSSEQKREKMEIKKDSILQDIFKPSEVNKIIKQKELEANIFGKAVRMMKKFEENNPYDESFKPQKRESGNETDIVEQKADSGESILEVDDAVKKLAKIFKILGVKSEGKKCENCDLLEEDSSEEEDEKKTKRLRMNKPSRKCTCEEEECPLCQDCLKCYRECKKQAVASRNMVWNRQTPSNLPYADEYLGLIVEKKPESLKEETDEDAGRPQEETAADRGGAIKSERTYRTKLPPSRDLVRLYFDNPKNKLLVWTKRGRRTMPWGPLATDLQLYRDRARQILKSAEDILQRIKDTEEKIHAGEQYGENDEGLVSDKHKKEKVMDDIIKKVVNEDVTKNVLRTPWVAELNKTETSLEEVERDMTEREKEIKENEESEFQIAVDQVAKPKPENQIAVDQVAKPKHENQLKTEEKFDGENASYGEEPEVITDKDESADVGSKSIEAAVESVEGDESYERAINDKVQGTVADVGEVESQRKSEETEDIEYEDLPAKVEAVSNRDALEDGSKGESLGKVVDRLDDNMGEDVKLEKSYSGEYREPDYGTEESGTSHSEEEVKASKEHMSESGELGEDKSASYENEREEVAKNVSYEEEEEEEEVRSTEKTESQENIFKENEEESAGDENIFQEQIKPLEQSYIVKGVQQAKEEKEAILKALLHAEELPEAVEPTTESEGLGTLIDHLSNGRMDVKDLEEVKNLDDRKIDLLVGEMQKKDENPATFNCDKHIKLCQIACGCNGTDTTTEIDKYDIIKGFLGWLKGVQIDHMVPISA